MPETTKQKPKLSPADALKALAHREPWSPSHVMKVETRGELQHLLRFYNKPILRDVSQTPYGRRYFMEYIRPTLRYYCKKLGVEIPDWLQGDEHHGHGKGDSKYMLDHFGKDKLEPAKWDEFMFEHLEDKPKKQASGAKKDTPKKGATPKKKAGAKKPAKKNEKR